MVEKLMELELNELQEMFIDNMIDLETSFILSEEKSDELQEYKSK